MSRSRQGLSSGWTATLVLLLAGAGGAAISNPTQEAHTQAIQAHCKSSAGVFGAMGCSLGLGVGKAVGIVQYEDYVVFSRLRVDKRVLSIGAFGMVSVQDDGQP